MFTCRATLATALILVGLCNAQQVVSNLDNSPHLIRNILNDAHVSGSLAYSTNCRPPIAPHVGTPTRSGSTAEVLQSMFGGRSTIHVTQERDGLIRMAEADVPTDILNIKAQHIVCPCGFRTRQRPAFCGHENHGRSRG